MILPGLILPFNTAAGEAAATAWTLRGEGRARIPVGTENGYDYPISFGFSLGIDDVAIIATACDGTPSVSGAQGYTLRFASGDALPFMTVSVQRFTSSPPSTFTLGYDGTYIQPVIWQVWRFCHADIFDNTAVSGVAALTGYPDPPSGGTGTDGALQFAFFGRDDDDVANPDDSSPTLVTAPTGYTNLITYDTGAGSGSGGSTIGMASKIIAGTGADNPGTFFTGDNTTGSGVSDDTWAWTMRLKPAA